MSGLCVRDTDDVVSGLTALEKLLLRELQAVEKLTCQSKEMRKCGLLDESVQAKEKCFQMRSALLSAIYSIHELFNWIRLLAEKDPEGNDLDCVSILPQGNVPSWA